MLPFKQLQINENKKIRIFEDASQEELCWHKDHNDRLVKVMEVGNGWEVQFDDELPKPIKVGDIIKIKANVWHRILKGDDRLVIKVFEKTN